METSTTFIGKVKYVVRTSSIDEFPQQSGETIPKKLSKSFMLASVIVPLVGVVISALTAIGLAVYNKEEPKAITEKKKSAAIALSAQHGSQAKRNENASMSLDQSDDFKVNPQEETDHTAILELRIDSLSKALQELKMKHDMQSTLIEKFIYTRSPIKDSIIQHYFTDSLALEPIDTSSRWPYGLSYDNRADVYTYASEQLNIYERVYLSEKNSSDYRSNGYQPSISHKNTWINSERQDSSNNSLMYFGDIIFKTNILALIALVLLPVLIFYLGRQVILKLYLLRQKTVHIYALTNAFLYITLLLVSMMLLVNALLALMNP